jgi:hypothetical protein
MYYFDIVFYVWQDCLFCRRYYYFDIENDSDVCNKSAFVTRFVVCFCNRIRGISMKSSCHSALFIIRLFLHIRVYYIY